MDLKEQFNKISSKYDSQRKKLIPCFDDFYGAAIDNFVLEQEDAKILDLGAGTGLFAQKVLDKYPKIEIDLVDLSDQMLAIARKRFLNCCNVHFIVSDYMKLEPTQRYDAIISSLSIHHLTDANKKQLYQNIYHWLVPGGIFINAEQVLGVDAYMENIYKEKWIAQITATDLTTEELKSAFERVKLDHRTPLNIQLEWLKLAGFENVDCLYKYYSFVVLWAKKSA